MIFYFSGTGNSRWVALELGRHFACEVRSMSDELNKCTEECTYEVTEKEPTILVFPVHSWGPAEIANRFINRLVLKGTDSLWVVVTCGDECGLTDHIVEKHLKKRDLHLNACYSVTMPNDYILLPGFDVDSHEIEQKKLQKAPDRVNQIANAIRNHQDAHELYTVGPWKRVKSNGIYPLFIKYALGSSQFRSTDSCIGCGICAQICPTHNISMMNERPIWGKECVQCVACINRCPVRAIEYGKISVKKGRYHHPGINGRK